MRLSTTASRVKFPCSISTNHKGRGSRSPSRVLAEAPSQQGKPGKRGRMRRKNTLVQSKISAVNVPVSLRRSGIFTLFGGIFTLSGGNFTLSGGVFTLPGGFFSLPGGIFALPGGMFACLAEFCPVWWVFRLVWWLVGYLLFTWPGGLLIELIALYPAWHWRRSALNAIRPLPNIQTAA